MVAEAVGDPHGRDFDRLGIHSKTGKVTLMQCLDMYIWHMDHHLQFLLDKKTNLGY